VTRSCRDVRADTKSFFSSFAFVKDGATTMTPRLKLTGIRKAFGATQALRSVTLRVEPGEVHALIGENGAGKSTLMKILSGAHVPDAGQIDLDGIPFTPRDPLHARRRGVAMIYRS
jgi:ribose transport system ATP-binding protein